jgi:uncharacterized protein YjbI with pentapeptide repeats
VIEATSGKGRKAEMTDSKPPSDSEERKDGKWYDRTRYQVVLFVGGIVLFVLLAGLILHLYIEPKNSGQKKDLVQALGLITAGVAGAVGIYFTWRGQRQAREAQENNQRNTLEQLEQSRNELTVNREGQITDRFTRAIDQLGKVDDNGDRLFEIRLGGIYALERIARESEEDHWPIMEVLTAYIRQNAPRKLEKESTAEGSDEEIRAPKADIQAIMTVLRRRTRFFGQGEPEPLDLHETNLSGANLSKANLSGANLSKANLSGANLSKANLLQVILREANLREANLREANLQEARLYRANLQGAFLQEANLQDANLQGAPLQGARLYRANLQGAPLQGVHLNGANLQEANLQGVFLLGAHLQDANLQDADLQGADGITNEELEQQARFLKGATMPDGQKYEEWRKDRESRREDGENE